VLVFVDLFGGLRVELMVVLEGEVGVKLFRDGDILTRDLKRRLGS